MGAAFTIGGEVVDNRRVGKKPIRTREASRKRFFKKNMIVAFLP
jgi:hypothetical protein